MALLKAIKITKDNRTSLETQYDLDEDMLKGWEGLTLVAHFGSSQAGIIGWMNDVALEKGYTKTGVQLDNGFFEVERK